MEHERKIHCLIYKTVLQYKYMWIPFALLSALSAAFVTIFGKIGLKNIDSTLATTVRSVIMAGFLVITSIFLGKWSMIHTIDKKTLFYIALSGIAGALSWLFYFFSLKNGPAGGVASIDRLSIVFIVVLSAFFLGEAITWKTATATLFVIIGAILFTLK